MLLSNRIKNIIKVAVLCTAVSLLSFYLGTKAHDIQQFKEINNSEASSQTHQNNQTSQNGQSSQGEEFFSEQNKYIAEEVRPILDVMEIIQNRFIREVDTSQLVDGAIKGMVSALKDRYSTYMKPSEFQEFINSLNGSLEGVGITIGIDENTGDIIKPLFEGRKPVAFDTAVISTIVFVPSTKEANIFGFIFLLAAFSLTVSGFAL